MSFMRNECPNCGSIWGPGSEEWEFQECDCCGWPSPDADNFEDTDDDYWEEDQEFEGIKLPPKITP